MWINYGKGEGKRVELENILKGFMRLKEDGIKPQHEIISQSMSPTNNPNQTKPNLTNTFQELSLIFFMT